MKVKHSKKHIFGLTPLRAGIVWIVLSALVCVLGLALGASLAMAVAMFTTAIIPPVIQLVVRGDRARENSDIWIAFAWTAIGLLGVLGSGGAWSPLVVMLALGPVYALSVGRFRLGLETGAFATLIYLVLVILDATGFPGLGANRLGPLTGPLAVIAVLQIGLFVALSGDVLDERRGQNREFDLWLATMSETPVLILNVDRNHRLRSWVGDIHLLAGVSGNDLAYARLEDLFANTDAFINGADEDVQPELIGDAQDVCEVNYLKTRDGYRFVITPRRSVVGGRDGANAAVWVASLGHELKNMLNPVGGYSDLILAERAGPLNEPYREFARSIKQGAEHLSLLVEDLMMAAKTRAGKLKLEPELLDAQGEAEDVIRLLNWQAEAQRVSILLSAEDSEAFVSADRKALRQILINLISNAIKYSPPGGDVEVNVSSTNEVVRFSVTDHGEGMPADEVERLGEPFFQGENAKSRAGTGLGLSIVMLLAEEMDGEVRFESELGHGTTAHLYLPAAETVTAEPELAAE